MRLLLLLLLLLGLCCKLYQLSETFLYQIYNSDREAESHLRFRVDACEQVEAEDQNLSFNWLPEINTWRSLGEETEDLNQIVKSTLLGEEHHGAVWILTKFKALF